MKTENIHPIPLQYQSSVQDSNAVFDGSMNTRAFAPSQEVKPQPKIKKLPPELRRGKIRYNLEPLWYKRLLLRLQHDSQFLRSVVQFAFVFLCLWIGIEFYVFMQWGISAGATTFIQRPPGVEGFLPISALMSLKYWIQTGIINDVHPSGLFIFVAIVAVGVLLKKAFCSWLCPVGTLSESLWILGQKIFGRNFKVYKWIDIPLRGIKYLLLFFFAYSIWQMNVEDLQAFIYSPYNKMADIKMFQFFAHISTFALWTIIILMVASVFIKNFWCRYLCPYGALLGITSLLSPLKITRTKETCIDCELCTKACPSNIKVHKVNQVWSDECTSCLACVEVCPVKNTLDIRSSLAKTKIPTWVFGSLIVGIFIAVTGMAMITGHWQNGMSKEEYLRRFPNMDSQMYQHNQGQVPKYTPQD